MIHYLASAWIIRDPVLIFALVMCILLAAPLLAARARMPSLIVLILAGTFIGPHGIGLLARDATFELLGTVGLLYLMFMAGLEIEMQDFQRRKHHSLLFGSITFAIPQAVGALLATRLFGFSWTTSILLASMFASHTLIPYPIIGRFGLNRQRAVTTAVGGTILTDTAALLVLAVIVQSHASQLNAAFWLRTVALLALLGIIVMVVMRRLAYLFFRRADTDGSAEFIFVLSMAFLSAYAAHLAGVEPIIGAFLAGLALSPLVPEQSPLMVRTRFVGDTLFIPFFLISVGMLIDLSILFSDLRSWMVCLFMSACVTLCKWSAAEISGRLLRYDRDERKILFGLSINQAAATLAAVLIGYDLGILDVSVLNGTILMILVTCIIGPLVTEKAARALSLRQLAPEDRPEDPTLDRILIPVGDRSDVSALLHLALLFRNAKSGAPLIPLHVVPDDSQVDNGIMVGERMLGHAVVQALSADAEVTPLTRIDINPAAGILRAAREMRASVMILGWGIRRTPYPMLSARTITARIIRNSTSMLVICRTHHPINAMRRIVLTIPPLMEHHAGFLPAMRRVFHMTRQLGTSLHLVGLRSTLDAVRLATTKYKDTPDITTDPLENWPPVDGCIHRLDDRADLLVLMTVRSGGLAWQPSLERMPDRVARDRPNLNILLVYLSERIATVPDYGGIAPDHRLADLTDGDTRRLVIRELDHTPFDEASLQLLDTCFAPDAEEARHTADALNQTTMAIELAPGVALLHAHRDSIPEPRVLIGLNREGWLRPDTTAPIQALIILLSVRGQPPEKHLEMLYRIAQFVKQGRMKEVAPWLD